MKKQPWCSFILAGVNLNEFGTLIPSPFSSLTLSNSEIASYTSWTLKCTVGGDATRKVNIAAFEALLYSAAQAASGYQGSAGIPVSFAAGWLNDSGKIEDYMSYQGFTLQFSVSTAGMYMIYELTGYATLAIQSSMPVINIPELSGNVQPSAILVALVKAVKADSYYQLDVDRNDSPTYVSHGAMTTSFNNYVRGTYAGTSDDYDSFPGLVKLSKSYSAARDSAGLIPTVKSLSSVINNISVTPLDNFLKKSITDDTVQCASFSYWVDEPTMTTPGTIHYKSNANLLNSQVSDVLEYGTANTNILSLSGSYNGVSYNMTDMNFSTVGFALDGSGSTIITDTEVVNSWSATLADVFQTVNIINDVNALASQFSGDFTITIPGSVKEYAVAQPISLLVMAGNTISPITGIYSIVSVTHSISSIFTTDLKVQRLVMSSANQVAASQGIIIRGSGSYPTNSMQTTTNVKSTHSVDFGTLYPNFEHIGNYGVV